VDLFEFEVWVGGDYFVWSVVEVFIFYGYVYYSDVGSFYDWRTVADFRVERARSKYQKQQYI